MPGRTTARKIDTAAYRRLLSKTMPIIPKTEQENERLLEQVDKLMSKPKLTLEEGALLDLLTAVIEKFEDEHYPIAEAQPHELLRFLMEEHGLRQRDMLDIFGRRSVISEVLSGARSISKGQAVKLGEKFKVQPSAFIDWRV
jgi:HTH-type transcriptional regulator/antitoxin HigA